LAKIIHHLLIQSSVD